tara:strand:+ start:264 stop:530 length:267 start_codon:yes stop_codon:yes gene_type:complete
MRDVKELKAWQLYAGQSIWFFFVGIVFYLVKSILDMTYLSKNKIFTSVYKVVESIGTGQAGADEGSKFAANILSGSQRAAMDPMAGSY